MKLLDLCNEQLGGGILDVMLGRSICSAVICIRSLVVLGSERTRLAAGGETPSPVPVGLEVPEVPFGDREKFLILGIEAIDPCC